MVLSPSSRLVPPSLVRPSLVCLSLSRLIRRSLAFRMCLRFVSPCRMGLASLNRLGLVFPSRSGLVFPSLVLPSCLGLRLVQVSSLSVLQAGLSSSSSVSCTISSEPVMSCSLYRASCVCVCVLFISSCLLSACARARLSLFVVVGSLVSVWLLASSGGGCLGCLACSPSRAGAGQASRLNWIALLRGILVRSVSHHQSISKRLMAWDWRILVMMVVIMTFILMVLVSMQ